MTSFLRVRILRVRHKFPKTYCFPQGFLVEKPKPIFGKKNSATSNLDQFSQEEVNKKQT